MYLGRFNAYGSSQLQELYNKYLGDKIDLLWKYIQFWREELVRMTDPTQAQYYEVIFLFVVVLIICFIIYLPLRELLDRWHDSSRAKSRAPLGLPSCDKYDAKSNFMHEALPFEWHYPDLIVENTKYNFTDSVRDPQNHLLYYLHTGTIVEFFPKR